MTDHEQRRRAVQRAEAKRGFREGVYKITLGDDVRWFSVEVTFYPFEKWWVTECDMKGNERKETRRELDLETQTKLETWL